MKLISIFHKMPGPRPGAGMPRPAPCSRPSAPPTLTHQHHHDTHDTHDTHCAPPTPRPPPPPPRPLPALMPPAPTAISTCVPRIVVMDDKILLYNYPYIAFAVSRVIHYVTSRSERLPPHVSSATKPIIVIINEEHWHFELGRNVPNHDDKKLQYILGLQKYDYFLYGLLPSNCSRKNNSF
jgi:hypothetical protein